MNECINDYAMLTVQAGGLANIAEDHDHMAAEISADRGWQGLLAMGMLPDGMARLSKCATCRVLVLVDVAIRGTDMHKGQKRDAGPQQRH